MIWWPVVQQRLVALLPTLSGFTGVVVHDGEPRVDVDAKKSVSVGWSSMGPLGGSRGSGLGDSGNFSFTPDGVDGMRGENGTVMCEFIVWDGDESAGATCRQQAFDLVNALDVSIRTDQRLGVLPESSTSDLSAEVVTAQDQSGATQRLVVSVSYFVRS